jgi:hypothetical protein
VEEEPVTEVVEEQVDIDKIIQVQQQVDYQFQKQLIQLQLEVEEQVELVHIMLQQVLEKVFQEHLLQ